MVLIFHWVLFAPAAPLHCTNQAEKLARSPLDGVFTQEAEIHARGPRDGACIYEAENPTQGPRTIERSEIVWGGLVGWEGWGELPASERYRVPLTDKGPLLSPKPQRSGAVVPLPFRKFSDQPPHRRSEPAFQVIAADHPQQPGGLFWHKSHPLHGKTGC